MEILLKYLTNNITVNILIGFFYSAIIGFIIFYLTNFYNLKNNIKSLEVDLTKYTFLSQSIRNSVIKFSELDGKVYRKYFADILDGKQIKISEYKGIEEFIIFDSVPFLPEINDYLVEIFIKYFESKVDNRELIELLNKDKLEKEAEIINKNLFLIIYNDLNRKIKNLNERLDYYRYITKELICADNQSLNDSSDKILRLIKVFRYCIDSIISESKEIVQTLDLLDKAIKSNKELIRKEIVNNENMYILIKKVFIIGMVLSLVLLTIA